MRLSLPYKLSGRKYPFLVVILLAGLINGLLYTFIVPPWQHYDEPGHFEYAWLVANHPGLPKPGEYDQGMRREVAASMLEHGFFQGLTGLPNLLSQTEPIWIGVSQTNDLPLYYWIEALPLRLIRTSDVTFQLFVTRLVSVLFFLGSILFAYGLARELVPAGHPLVWMLPLTLVLLPGFVDIMSAVNNDVGAAAFFSLFLWLSVRMIRRGFTWLRLLGIIAAAAACFFTKNTVTIAVLFSAMALLLSILRGERRRFAWIALGLGVLAGCILIFSWGDAAGWTRQTQQAAPTRVATQNTPLGNHAFQLIAEPKTPAPQIFQVLPRKTLLELRGKTVTLGAWMWAEGPTQARPPQLKGDNVSTSEMVEVDTRPAFYAIRVNIPGDADKLLLTLAPGVRASTKPITVYYDGIVLAEGSFKTTAPPGFDDAAGARGSWDKQPFTNLVENPLAGQAWPWIRPQVESLIRKYFPAHPSLILSAILDWPSATWYYRATAQNLFETFWGKFGWGHVPLTGQRYLMPVLGAISLAGLLSSAFFLVRRRRNLPWDVILFLGAVSIVSWGFALMRGVDSLVSTSFTPSARYAFPAIIPTSMILVVGYLEISRLAEKYLRVPKQTKTFVCILAFTLFNLLALVSIWRFYHAG